LTGEETKEKLERPTFAWEQIQHIAIHHTIMDSSRTPLSMQNGPVYVAQFPFIVLKLP